MNVEVHVIQNFPPSCLNRDDTNTPKSCLFGGYRRARVSSQCLKRTIRLHMRDALDLPVGTRTRLLARVLADRCALSAAPDSLTDEQLAAEREGEDWQAAHSAAKLALAQAGFKFDGDRTSVGLYLAEEEIAGLAAALKQDLPLFAAAEGQPASAAEGKPAPRAKAGKKAKDSGGLDLPHWSAAVKSLGSRVRAVDIGLFARMIAEAPEMELDAACQVAHALSTHAADPETDYFTAVDDEQPDDEAGAGMLGLLGFTSPCLYRYALIQREQLMENLGTDASLTNSAILGFVRATIDAIPHARKNSTAPQTRPDYVRVTVNAAMPLNLVNAFERPVRAVGEDDSIAEKSILRLEEHHDRVRRVYPDSGAQSFRCCVPLDRFHDGGMEELLTWLTTQLEAA